MARAGLVGLLVCAALVPAGSGSLLAEDRDAAAREVAEGEKLARAGLYPESIARFKAAEELAPRAAHDCLIALSYFRLGRLGQAQLFMQRCAARASGTDPAPDWVVPMGNDVKKAIAASDHAAVTLTVRPAAAAAGARVTSSALASDESFGPGTFHLPPGEHTFRVEAEGYDPVDRDVAVTSKQPIAIDVTLEPAPRADAAGPRSAAVAALGAEPADQPAGRGPWPYVVLGVAGASLLAGVVMHAKALDTKKEAESSRQRFMELANDYESQRTFTYALYTVALVSGAIGTWLWFRGAPDDGAGGFHASAGPTADGGAFVTVGWQR